MAINRTGTCAYQKPQILLIDEATATMDRRTEQFVIKLLQRLKKKMIIIFVTHRVQLARQTDHIFVLTCDAFDFCTKIKSVTSQEEIVLVKS